MKSLLVEMFLVIVIFAYCINCAAIWPAQVSSLFQPSFVYQDAGNNIIESQEAMSNAFVPEPASYQPINNIAAAPAVGQPSYIKTLANGGAYPAQPYNPTAVSESSIQIPGWKISQAQAPSRSQSMVPQTKTSFRTTYTVNPDNSLIIKIKKE